MHGDTPTHTIRDRSTTQSKPQTGARINCCSLKPLKSGMFCCTTDNLNNLCCYVLAILLYQCPQTNGICLSVGRKGTGKLQCRTPEREEAKCGALNRQASVRILALPLTSCDLGPVTWPPCMYESNYMTFQLCDTFFKMNRMRWRNLSFLSRTKKGKNHSIFFSCSARSSLFLTVIFSEYEIKIENNVSELPITETNMIFEEDMRIGLGTI